MADTDTAAPELIAIELMMQSAVPPVASTVPSKTGVSSAFVALNQAAVPVALALESCVMAAKVPTPALGEPLSAVALKVSCASRVPAPVAASALAG
jgi:hypothetical protein